MEQTRPYRAMHRVYGCGTSGIVVAVYAAVMVLLLAIVLGAGL